MLSHRYIRCACSEMQKMKINHLIFLLKNILDVILISYILACYVKSSNVHNLCMTW